VRVLVADDEQVLAETVAEGLRRLSIAVDVCYDGAAALERLWVTTYDVAVLDRDMPEVHGDDVCRWITGHQPSTRVLMLTAAGSIRERVQGLGIGADDYLTKPFAFAELAARVQALGRRREPAQQPVLESATVTLDVPRHQVFRNGELLGLSPKEFGVLQVLMERSGQVVSAETLLDTAWDENIDPFTNVVRVTIQTLRRKLADPPVIETIRGVGYQIR